MINLLKDHEETSSAVIGSLSNVSEIKKKYNPPNTMLGGL